MFGDNTDQTNTAPAVDNAMNPAQPPADTTAAMGAAPVDASMSAGTQADAATPGAPDMTFPSVPNTDPITVADATTTSAPAATPTDSTQPDPAVSQPPVMPDPLSMPSTLTETTEATSTESDEPAEPAIPEPIATAPSEEAEAAGPAEVLASEDTSPTVMSTDDSSSSDDDSNSDEETSTDDESDSSPESTDQSAPASEELIGIKQQALEDLGPLVDKLDQTPEERFRTTMMLIQASDNQVLVKQAFDAAQDIKDDKERAQALLDVINEINYFTTQNK